MNAATVVVRSGGVDYTLSPARTRAVEARYDRRLARGPFSDGWRIAGVRTRAPEMFTIEVEVFGATASQDVLEIVRLTHVASRITLPWRLVYPAGVLDHAITPLAGGGYRLHMQVGSVAPSEPRQVLAGNRPVYAGDRQVVAGGRG